MAIKKKSKVKSLTSSDSVDISTGNSLKAKATPMSAIGSVITPKPTAWTGMKTVAEIQAEKDMSEESAAKPGDNIYDPDIGGYGKANPGESGAAAVARIKKERKKARVKG